MQIIRIVVRMTAFLALTIIISFTIFIILTAAFLFGRREEARQKYAHKLFNIFLKVTHVIMGIRIHWSGKSPKEPSVVMGNHRSYLDAVVLPTSFPVVFVGKQEAKAWPIIGWGASVLGTIWVKRDNKESRKATRIAVKERFDNGYGVIIFPEGTTNKNPELLPYRKGIFYLCAENGFQIAPVAIEYRDPDISWVSGWFITHTLRHLGVRYIDTYVSFGPIFKSNDAEKLIVDVRSWTQKECTRLRELIDSKA
ncbi:MAG: 1-acyl-sn-glycerol-3-phosphate acyltransferase [Flavobacteriales bacterium]|nr:1-acyl-sn-glycerol-3-phosphate acyltransferase [Flavobacteriales bacterium]